MGYQQGARTYTTSELAQAVSEKARTIQFWTDCGVLKPEPDSARQGKGVHRRFSETEQKIALLARALAWSGSPIGEIESVVGTLRALNPAGSIEAGTRDDLSLLCDRIGLLGIGGGFSGSAHIVISYYGVADRYWQLRFWGDDLSGCSLPIDVYAKCGIVDFIAFKAVPLRVSDIRLMCGWASLFRSRADEKEHEEFSKVEMRRQVEQLLALP